MNVLATRGQTNRKNTRICLKLCFATYPLFQDKSSCNSAHGDARLSNFESFKVCLFQPKTPGSQVETNPTKGASTPVWNSAQRRRGRNSGGKHEDKGGGWNQRQQPKNTCQTRLKPAVTYICCFINHTIASVFIQKNSCPAVAVLKVHRPYFNLVRIQMLKRRRDRGLGPGDVAANHRRRCGQQGRAEGRLISCSRVRKGWLVCAESHQVCRWLRATSLACRRAK